MLILFFGLLFALRFVHLGADPPHDMSRSMGYMSDPGGYAHNARNKVVFGRWETDMWNLMYISPLPHFCTYAAFAAAGPGVAQMNLVPVLFSCMLLIVTYRLFRAEFSKSFALVGILLLAVNYQFLMFSRIAVRVMPLLFFSLGALWFLNRKTPRRRDYFWAGALAFVAFTVKATFMQILPALVLGTALHLIFRHRRPLKPAAVSLSLFFCGMTLVGLVWLFTLYFPHKAMFIAYGGENIAWLTPKSVSEGLTRFWQRPLFFFNEMPVIACLSGLSLLSVFYRFSRDPRRITLMEWICSLWVVTNILYYAVISYHAARHFVVLVFPLIVLSTAFLRQIYATEALKKPERQPWPFYPLMAVWSIFTVSAAVIIRARPVAAQWGELQRAFRLTLGLSLGLTLAAFLVLQFWPRRLRLPLPRALRVSAVAGLVLLALFLNVKPYAAWVLHPRFHIRDISRDLGRFKESMVIGGLLAPVITLENRHGAHPYRTGYINPYPDFLERFGISHVLLTLHAGEVEKKQYLGDFPARMKQARLLARYPLWATFAEFYQLDPPPPAAAEGEAWEGETFFGEGGIPRFDPQASNALAFRLARIEGPGRLLISVGEYPPGAYRAVCRLKIPASPRPADPIARLEILSQKGSRRIDGREIRGGDFLKADVYQDFDVAFRLNSSRPLMLRILTNGRSDLWVDRIAIHRSEDPAGD